MKDFLFSLLILAVTISACTKEKPLPTDKEKVQGYWTLKNVTCNGNPFNLYSFTAIEFKEDGIGKDYLTVGSRPFNYTINDGFITFYYANSLIENTPFYFLSDTLVIERTSNLCYRQIYKYVL